MRNKTRPLLSIGIIFKNEIRCLERCLQSFQALREAVPCEIVMADTGSTDGSRHVAERYADILFDFPWTDDFSAARNAVMDRCTGKWYLSVDADEWLDGDITELVEILRQAEKAEATAYRVMIRNYVEFTINDEFAESMGLRLLWMDTGLRFLGTIHEIWPIRDAPVLRRTLLHHDGYANADSEAGHAKRARNMALLCKELEKEPDSLKIVLQCIESSRGMPDCMEYVRRGADLVEAKKPGWEVFGPPVFRHGALECDEQKLPELNEWIARAEETFPDSFFTRIDVMYTALRHAWKDEQFSECIRCGQIFLAAMLDLYAGRGDQEAQSYSTIVMSSPRWAVNARVLIANACVRENDPEQAWELLADVDGRKLNAAQAGSAALTLRQIHTRTRMDTRERLLQFYEQICTPEPDEEQAAARKKAFMQEAVSVFSEEYRQYETTLDYILRPAYTLFLPLAGKCEVGTIAAVLAGDELPAMRLEDMDTLAGLMVRLDVGIAGLAISAGKGSLPDSLHALTWSRALALAAVRAEKWEDEARGLELCRVFARTMGVFLMRYYAPEVLCEENIALLAPLFRFGWYCSHAFAALDAGDTAEYVKLLHRGLEVNPEMKPMVEFLTEHTPQLQGPKPTGELLALAEKVRMMLATYDPNDPAVAALKASPVYQRVAHLIEGPDTGLYGGISQ